MDNIKIGVYTICKDEAKFVRRWLESMYCGGQGADAAYVLDTGSSDGTPVLFDAARRELGIPEGWLHLSQRHYDTFRFDTARNDNLAMTEGDGMDALVSVDLDEILIPDFWPDVRKAMAAHPDFERVYYLYAWNHDENGAPKRVFWYDKVHPARGVHWQYPVHEAIVVEDGARQGQYYLDASKIYLHHWADTSKSRGSYLGLLELRAQEAPEDIFGLFYLAREYQFRDLASIRGIEVALRGYAAALGGAEDNFTCLPFFALAVADGLRARGLMEDAEHFYRRALELGPELRQPYLSYAHMAVYQGRHALALSLLETMERRAPTKYPTWYERDYNWTWYPHQIRAVALCWAGKYLEAESVFTSAERDYILTDTDRAEAEAEGFYRDWTWLKEHLRDEEARE